MLEEILKAEFGHVAETVRVTMSGPPVAFLPHAAVALGMIFHELATNATKYGALSKAGGKLSVTWAIQPANGGPRQVIIEWTESGGPPVKAPKQNGFGSELIEREAKMSLKGTVTRSFAAKGLKVKIAVPLDGSSPASKPH